MYDANLEDIRFLMDTNLEKDSLSCCNVGHLSALSSAGPGPGEAASYINPSVSSP